MSKHRLSPILILLPLVGFFLTACSPAAPTSDSSNDIITRAAGTAAARLTAEASRLPPSTPAPTQAPTTAAEVLPSPTPTSAVTSIQATSPASSVTPTQSKGSSTSDAASFVADVNYPDNTPVKSGEKFTKTWRIKNTGTSDWTTSYSLVCIDPGKFQCDESSVSIPNDVKSGETVDISFALNAPSENGTFKAYFRLRNAAGQFFKLDQTGDLWVQVVVGQVSETATPTTGASTSTSTPTTAPATATITSTP